MDKSLIAESSIDIFSEASKIWKVLTDPDMIKQYLFGTELSTDWKKGSPIRFSGVYNGHAYEDKGNVLENKEHSLLQYNYWSGFSGLKDRPENYSIVTYNLE